MEFLNTISMVFSADSSDDSLRHNYSKAELVVDRAVSAGVLSTGHTTPPEAKTTANDIPADGIARRAGSLTPKDRRQMRSI